MVEYERLLLFVAVVVLLSVEHVVSDVAADKDGIPSFPRVLLLTTLEHPDTAVAVASAVAAAAVGLVNKVGAAGCIL